MILQDALDVVEERDVLAGLAEATWLLHSYLLTPAKKRLKSFV